MKFREKLRRGRSHLIMIAVMLITAAIVVSIDEGELANGAGQAGSRSSEP